MKSQYSHFYYYLSKIWLLLEELFLYIQIFEPKTKRMVVDWFRGPEYSWEQGDVEPILGPLRIKQTECPASSRMIGCTVVSSSTSKPLPPSSHPFVSISNLLSFLPWHSFYYVIFRKHSFWFILDYGNNTTFSKFCLGLYIACHLPLVCEVK